MLALIGTLMTGLLSGASSFSLAPKLDSERRISLRSSFSTETEEGAFSVPVASFDYQNSLPESEYSQVLISELPIALEVREYWDRHFQDPRQPDAKRFSWDPWYVEVGDGKFGADTSSSDNSSQKAVDGEVSATNRQIQYSLKRTTTSSFLDDAAGGDLYDRLVDELVGLGTSIGLTAITPPWISLYTDGDMQNYHTDAPHGPLAFVLSLCREGEFSGGETMMLQPRMLEYWRGFDGSNGIECGSIVRFIPPTPLGRFIAFDPRVPHGVNRVSGTQDPRKGRIVIHGWFNEPETCWFGPWDLEKGSSTPGTGTRMETLDAALQPLVETLGTGEIGRVMGYLAVKLEIDTDGLVEEVMAVCDTLQADWDDFRGIIGYDEADRPVMEDAVSDVRLTAFETLKELVFEPGPEGRAVVVPFLFE